MKKITLLFLAVFAGFTMNAQTADEILNNYFENIGGKEKLKAIKGIKTFMKLNMQGMEIPIESVQLADGRQVSTANFQGKEIKQGVFDGETLWSHNFMTMKAEKSPKEATDNFKLNSNDFPGPFLGYKEKGYTVELLGKEEIEGTEAFKIKLVKEPITVDGKKEDDVTYYFFDTENFVPIATQSVVTSGPMKGQTSQMLFSDYQEVDGLYFPFSMTMGLKGQAGGQTMVITKMELNPTIDDDAFKFPEDKK